MKVFLYCLGHTFTVGTAYILSKHLIASVTFVQKHIDIILDLIFNTN